VSNEKPTREKKKRKHTHTQTENGRIRKECRHKSSESLFGSKRGTKTKTTKADTPMGPKKHTHKHKRETEKREVLLCCG
jgi:hypothetical protein